MKEENNVKNIEEAERINFRLEEQVKLRLKSQHDLLY